MSALRHSGEHVFLFSAASALLNGKVLLQISQTAVFWLFLAANRRLREISPQHLLEQVLRTECRAVGIN
jgi:hypothetical protein